MVAKDRDDDNSIARRPKEAVWFARAPNIMVDVSTFDGMHFYCFVGVLRVLKSSNCKESQLESI